MKSSILALVATVPVLLLTSCGITNNNCTSGPGPASTLTFKSLSPGKMILTQAFSSRAVVIPAELDGKPVRVNCWYPMTLDAGHHKMRVAAIARVGERTNGFLEMDLGANRSYTITGRSGPGRFDIHLRDVTNAPASDVEIDAEAAGTLVRSYRLDMGGDLKVIQEQPGSHKMIE